MTLRACDASSEANAPSSPNPHVRGAHERSMSAPEITLLRAIRLKHPKPARMPFWVVFRALQTMISPSTLNACDRDGVPAARNIAAASAALNASVIRIAS